MLTLCLITFPANLILLLFPDHRHPFTFHSNAILFHFAAVAHNFIIITPTLLCYIDYNIIKNKHLEYLIFDPTDNNNNYATHIKSLSLSSASALSSSSLSSSFKFISLCAQIPHHLSPTLPSDNTFSFLRTNDDADDDNDDDGDDGDRIDIANR